MKVEIVTRWSELTRHHDSWLELLERSGCNVPTLSPLWLESWWHTFGGDEGRQLRVGLIFRGDRLVGLVPFQSRWVRYRNVLPMRRLELLGSGEREEDEICSDYIGIVAESGKEALIARTVADALRHGTFGYWDEMVLDLMNGEAAMTAQLIDKLRRVGIRVEQVDREPCPYAELPTEWDEYLSRLSSNSRSMVRRTLRDLKKWAGDTIEVHRAKTDEDLERGLQILIDLHGQRWQEAGRQGVFGSQKFLAFHRRVMAELLARDQLDLMWLSCHGEPIAALYNIVWNRQIFFYQSGRRVDLPKKVRPGVAMHAYAIQHAMSRGCTVYDFLSGASRYKKQLSTGQNPLVQLRASPRYSVPAALQRQARRGEGIARRVRQEIRDQMQQRFGDRDGE